MAPKTGKRTAAPGAAGRPRKAAKTFEHPTQHGERLQGVLRAVEGAAGLPDTCRAMLLALLPPSLGAPADARHPLQAHAVGLVAEALAQVRSEKEAALSAAAAGSAQAEARQVELEAAKDGAESALELKAGRARETEAALDAAGSGRGEVRAALDAARRAEQGSRLAESAKRAECDAFGAALAEHFAALRGGAWGESAAAGERHLAALEPALQKAELDSSIAASFRVVGAKRAADRTSFEVMVLEQVGASLSEKAASLRAELAERAPAVAERAAEVAARQAEVESAEAEVQERASLFERAQAEKQGGEEARAAAALALQGFASELAAATEAKDAAQVELDLFLQGPLADFELLRDTTGKAAEAAAEAAERSAASAGGA